MDFNPRFPRGKRRAVLMVTSRESRFQSTLPAREATEHAVNTDNLAVLFQSTLPAREATKVCILMHNLKGNFNPRFPRGKRRQQAQSRFPADNFNPRFPRGKRHQLTDILRGRRDFNPRFPRGKRPQHPVLPGMPPDFNPRFPRGKRPVVPFRLLLRHLISIHASREGSDLAAAGARGIFADISIHASREGSDAVLKDFKKHLAISIHASREGSDMCLSFGSARRFNFNPRFPRGKRP